MTPSPRRIFYAVVKTVENGNERFSVVPTNWVFTSEKNKTLLKWPGKKVNVSHALKKHVEPGDDWMEFECEVKATDIDSEIIARKIEKTYVEEGSTDSQEYNNERNKLRRKHPVQINSEDETEVDEIASKAKKLHRNAITPTVQQKNDCSGKNLSPFEADVNEIASKAKKLHHNAITLTSQQKNDCSGNNLSPFQGFNRNDVGTPTLHSSFVKNTNGIVGGLSISSPSMAEFIGPDDNLDFSNDGLNLENSVSGTPSSANRIRTLESVENNILQSIQAVLKVQARMKVDIAELLKRTSDTNRTSSSSLGANVLETQFPIREIEQLEKLESELANDEKFQALSKKIMRIGGLNAESFLRNTAKSLFEDKLLEKFSVKGRKGKHPFIEKKRIIAAHVEGINMNKVITITESQVTSFYGRYLKNAPGRIKSKFTKFKKSTKYAAVRIRHDNRSRKRLLCSALQRLD